MNALVTGGAGFIGSNLVEALRGDGAAVTVLDDLSSGFMENIEGVDGVRFIEGDVRDADAVKVAMRGLDFVFHLAASVGNKRSIDDPIKDAQINVLGTLNVLEAARKSGVKKVVISSSAGIYGELKTIPIKEDHWIEPDSPYGCTKLCEEKEGLAYGKLYGMDVVALRYFNVYGIRQRFDSYGNVIPIFVFKLLKGETITVFGDGEQTRDFVNVKDVVQANIGAALSPGVKGAFNIASGTSITINELIRLIFEAAGSRTAVVHAGKRPGDVLHSLADISAANGAFGYLPRSDIKEGLVEYVKWARTLE